MSESGTIISSRDLNEASGSLCLMDLAPTRFDGVMGTFPVPTNCRLGSLFARGCWACRPSAPACAPWKKRRMLGRLAVLRISAREDLVIARQVAGLQLPN